jgi:hypothetical protein
MVVVIKWGASMYQTNPLLLEFWVDVDRSTNIIDRNNTSTNLPSPLPKQLSKQAILHVPSF